MSLFKTLPCLLGILACLAIPLSAGCKFSTAGLTNDNQAAVCGNGIAEGNEICDGDDTRNTACADITGYVGGTLRCSGDCQSYNTDNCIPEGQCGNGDINPPEECDTTNLNGQSCESLNLGTGTLACNIDCTFDLSGCSQQPDCGNNIVEGTEECDDGNQSNEDACLNACLNATCGDGYVWAGHEECDDGNNIDGDSCSAICEDEPPVNCGNGQIETGETCDDGNTNPDDGCSPACLVETGWDCQNQPSVCTPICGDGLIRGTEECDDTNLTNGDGCSDLCEVEPFYACSGEHSVCVCVVFVDINTTSALADGSSWADATKSVQHGIDTAANKIPGCEVWVAQGRYYIYTSSVTDTLLLAADVGVYGGFDATENARDQRDWVSNDTILDGNSQLTSDRVNHVVTADQISGAVLDGFRIVAGLTGMNGSGAGMIINQGSVTVENCTFRRNEADWDGGGLAVYNSNSTITNCTFFQNAAQWGGGMLVEGGDTTVEDCIFEANNATNWGGGLYFYNTDSTATGCDFLNNTASGWGGGFIVTNNSPTVEGCFFEGNDANRGGGFMADLTDVHVTGCWFESNTATSSGGGLCADTAAPTVENSVFWSNTSAYGGGLQSRNSSAPYVVNSTFFDNSSTNADGHAIRTYNSTATSVNIIAWGTATGEIAHNGSGTTTVTYSTVQGGYSGSGNLDTNPNFVDAAGGNFRLQPGSPAMDSADGNAAPSADFDGNLRVDHASAPNNGTGNPNYADRGAFETQ
jgi:cysteine-rich repeat protein/predicted outer membrane repeat protein